jgi:hypothetical protein
MPGRRKKNNSWWRHISLWGTSGLTSRGNCQVRADAGSFPMCSQVSLSVLLIREP